MPPSSPSDVIAALQAVLPYDWESFLRERIDQAGAPAPMAGIERGGYRLVYRDTPSSYSAASDAVLGSVNLMFSIGITIGGDGALKEVIWGSPAFDAGLTSGTTLLAVNGRAYTADELKRAISAAKDGEGIELLVKSGKRHRTVGVDYAGGLRYPHLEPVAGSRRRLDEILAPRRGR